MIDDMTLHGLKPETIRAYVDGIARFARHFGKSPELLGTAEIRSSLLYLTRDRHVASSISIQAICAQKSLCRIALRKGWGGRTGAVRRGENDVRGPVVDHPDSRVPGLRRGANDRDQGTRAHAGGARGGGSERARCGLRQLVRGGEASYRDRVSPMTVVGGGAWIPVPVRTLAVKAGPVRGAASGSRPRVGRVEAGWEWIRGAEGRRGPGAIEPGGRLKYQRDGALRAAAQFNGIVSGGPVPPGGKRLRAPTLRIQLSSFCLHPQNECESRRTGAIPAHQYPPVGMVRNLTAG